MIKEYFHWTLFRASLIQSEQSYRFLNSIRNAVHNEITDHFTEWNKCFLDRRIFVQLFSLYKLRTFYSPFCQQITSIYAQPVYFFHAVAYRFLRSSLKLSFYLLPLLYVFFFILFPIHILYTSLMSSIRVICFSRLCLSLSQV